MTLGDFFTLTEMNNGLTAPFRVRELIAVMQKEGDCIVKNAADSARQRSAVASALAATENKGCLDLFVQLDGLNFISSWLKDAQKLSNDTTDSFLEESISHLLRALANLHIDYGKLVVSEIWTSVENLLHHNSPKVQDKARVLLESWKTKRDIIDASRSDVDKTGASSDVKARESADIRGERESSPKNASIPRETSIKDNGHGLNRDGQVLSANSGDVFHCDQVEGAQNSNKILDLPTGNERPLGHVSPASSSQYTLDGTHLDFHGPKSKTSEGRPFTSSSNAVAETKAVTELTSQKNTNAGNANPCNESLPYIDSDGKNAGDGSNDPNQCESSNAFIAKKDSVDVSCSVLPKSFSSEKSWGKFLSGIRDYLSDDDLANNYAFGKSQMDRESGKKSDVEIDYRIVDPLEVAMQVAMEVEREIVDYREQICNSSEKLPGSNTNGKQSDESPGSLSGKQSHSSGGPSMEAENSTNSSQESATTSSENLNTNGPQDVASSQVIEAAQAKPNTKEKSPCNLFDLNQEIFSEDCNRSPENHFLAPVSVVSASRATAASPKLPGTPLQFDGNLGWKGSALTSAFRPASPRRMPESDFSTGGSSSNSKQRQEGCCLDFDLNVSGSVGESSVETNSKRSEHLKLDLNRTSEDGGALLNWRLENFFPGGNLCQSSSNQPTKNIDLNDQPSFLDVKVSQGFNVSNGINIKLDDSAISIMGTRVEVGRNDFLVSQTSSLQDSRTPEAAFDYNLARVGNFVGIGSAMPYGHSPVYGYSNIAPGPAMPFSGPVYGSGHHSIPYMVDSRGAPVIPQIMGSGSVMPTAFSQPPFVINMNSSLTPLNSVGPSRSGFDLNTGKLAESGSRDPAGLGLFLNSTQVRSIDGPNSQAILTSAVDGKRKEPDNGYNDHCYPFKHYTQPWK